MNNPIILYIMITSFITTNSFSQKTIGSIDRIEKEINSLIAKNTKIVNFSPKFESQNLSQNCPKSLKIS